MIERIRHLLALVEARDHVCYRYRLAGYAPLLASAGWSLHAVPLARSGAGFWRQMEAVARADVVVLQRRLLPWWQRQLLRRAAKRLVFDFDDAVFLRDHNASKRVASVRRRWRFRATIRQADLVLAGNRFLLQHAAADQQTPKSGYLPTCINPDLYPPARHDRRGDAACLAWIGSRSTAGTLELLRPGLAAAARRLPGMELRVISDWCPDLADLRVRRRPWSSATEAHDLAEADIGVSWLPQHPWSLGKCGLKVLQYMAAGLPVVANPVGIHWRLVRHGETGFLAASPEDWADAIARLAASPELRHRMGDAARRWVAEHYGTSVWGPQLLARLESLVEGPAATTPCGATVVPHLAGIAVPAAVESPAGA